MFEQFFFDKQDRELLRMINATIDRGTCSDSEQSGFDANLHAHGILELTTSHEYRMARAVINLLGSLEAGQIEDRLAALRILRDEVLHSARTSFRHNTGRVLIQIMKKIVRSRDDEATQLGLVHDFRKVASGNPRLVRGMLTQYHLLEMPEAWNQLAFDHHVHDANTKGRKNPTHLIMDAWIKGIRYLTVVYYNYVEANAARELLQAAETMGIFVRIGLEFQARFRGRYVRFVWAPRGFSDAEAFLTFLAERPMVALMQEGRKASLWLQRHVLATLDLWNRKHLPKLCDEFGVNVPPLDPARFLVFVGSGQASFLHLAEFAHKSLIHPLFERTRELENLPNDASPEVIARNNELIRRMDSLTPEVILETWIKPERNPELPSPDVPRDDPETPELLRMPPHVLLDWLSCLRSGYRIILQLSGLSLEDVLELLWDCQGIITHLELFNLKEWQENKLQHLNDINELQIAINEASVLPLKRMLRTMLHKLEQSDVPEDQERCAKFRVILRNIPCLQHPYGIAPLRSRFGTDSTSHSSTRYGMGLVVPATLPASARRLLREGRKFSPLTLPLAMPLAYREVFTVPARQSAFMEWLGPRVRRLWGMHQFGLNRISEWRGLSAGSHMLHTQKEVTERGNVITMGGFGGEQDNGLHTSANRTSTEKAWPGLARLNTSVANTLKVLAGFIPALLTFLYTQDWWVLAWLGAPIWFLITGLRNIAQAIVSGGGVGKHSLLRWEDHVSWSRICDSLLYTGLSVVLLEWLIRLLLLDRMFDLTVSNSPLIVFTVIATTNSIYIASHNIYRGFPKEAIIGNLFRNALAIPVSMLYNEFFFWILEVASVTDPAVFLEPGAAIVSKTASDTVAGIIEGFADRKNNHRLRQWDYSTKLKHFFDCYAKLELAFPDQDILSLLARPKEFMRLTSEEAHSLQIASIINALDLMYFWMYQPCAQQTLIALLRGMSREERVILARGQGVLVRVREVSQLFVDGLLGKHFSRALSFYLDSHERYITAITAHCVKVKKR